MRPTGRASALYLDLAARGVEAWVEGAFDPDGRLAEEPPPGPVRLCMDRDESAPELGRLVERIKADEIALWTVCVSTNGDCRAAREEARA